MKMIIFTEAVGARKVGDIVNFTDKCAERRIASGVGRYATDIEVEKFISGDRSIEDKDGSPCDAGVGESGERVAEVCTEENADRQGAVEAVDKDDAPSEPKKLSNEKS